MAGCKECSPGTCVRLGKFRVVGSVNSRWAVADCRQADCKGNGNVRGRLRKGGEDIYIYIYIYIHTHTHVYIYIYACTYMYIYIYIGTHTNSPTHPQAPRISNVKVRMLNASLTIPMRALQQYLFAVLSNSKYTFIGISCVSVSSEDIIYEFIKHILHATKIALNCRTLTSSCPHRPNGHRGHLS